MASSGYVVRLGECYYAEDPSGAAYPTKNLLKAAVFDERTANRVAQLEGGVVEPFQLPEHMEEEP